MIKISRHIEHVSHQVAEWTGSTSGLIACLMSIAAWFIGGALVGFTNHWAEAVTIYIEMITFLIVFIHRRAQTKELDTLHLNLNELLLASKGADKSVIKASTLPEEELAEWKQAHHDQSEQPADKKGDKNRNDKK